MGIKTTVCNNLDTDKLSQSDADGEYEDAGDEEDATGDSLWDNNAIVTRDPNREKRYKAGETEQYRQLTHQQGTLRCVFHPRDELQVVALLILHYRPITAEAAAHHEAPFAESHR